MLHLHFCRYRCICYVLLFVAVLAPLHADAAFPQLHEPEEISRYFASRDMTLEEIADFLDAIRSDIQARGMQVPSLVDLFVQAYQYLIARGVSIPERDLSDVYDVLSEKEAIACGALHTTARTPGMDSCGAGLEGYEVLWTT